MLLIPSFRTIGSTTVYQHDSPWYAFVVVPGEVKVRRDEAGRAIFLLTTLGLSADDRADDPTLPTAVGYVNFDVEFAVSEADRTAIRAELQRWVDDEFLRRKADPALADSPELSGDTPPAVELSDPQLTGGTVSMQAPQSELLVSHRFAEAPASLVAGSNAVFNMDLTAAGAAYMRQLMLNESGAGGVDLTPIQVIYQLNMLARLPPVTVSVSADSSRVHETLVTISETNQDNICTPAEVETFRENGVNSSNLVESGVVTVKVDKGDATVPDDVVHELQQYALDLFDTMIEERFLVPAEADDEALEFGDDEPPLGEADRDTWVATVYEQAGYRGRSLRLHENARSLGGLNGKVRSVRVRAGHRVTFHRGESFTGASSQLRASDNSVRGRWRSAKLWRPPSSRYKVREGSNTATMELGITLERSQVVEWPLVAQATLQTFFAGVSEQDIRRHVVHVDANFFDSLNVEVRALLDFVSSGVRAIEVELVYEAKDGDGEAHSFTDTFTIEADDSGVRRFDPAVVNSHRSYRHRHRVIYANGEVSAYTPWENTTNRDLNITVRDAGRLSLEITTAGQNWEIVRSVALRLSHGSGDSRIQQSFLLTAAQPSVRFETRLSAGSDADTPVSIDMTYALVDGKVIDAEPRTMDVADTLFSVPPPQVDVLNVSLLPAGAWQSVAQVVVQMEYKRGDGRVHDSTFRLGSIDEFVTWEVLLDDPARRTFRYQHLIAYKSGDSEQSGWIEAEGDQTILIDVPGPDVINVAILPAMVDFEHTPAAVVTLRYGDQTQTRTFTDSTVQHVEWTVEPALGSQFTYEVTWHPFDGNSISSGFIPSASNQLLIPRAQNNGPGELHIVVRGFAVDYAVTPFVDVTFEWDDNGDVRSGFVSLHEQRQNADFSAVISDRTQRDYHYRVMYTLDDGTRRQGASGTTDDAVISVVPLSPTA